MKHRFTSFDALFILCMGIAVGIAFATLFIPVY
jgi:hypothetical protein